MPHYPCLFGQTKYVPGIKYRKLRHEENNYYESDESVGTKKENKALDIFFCEILSITLET